MKFRREGILSKKESCAAKKTSIGGQALIEGIMMRGPKMSAMAVRNPEGEIVLEKWETKSSTKSKFFKLPIIRGVFNFIDSMTQGYKCLMRSAEISGLDELEEQARLEKEAKKAAKAKKKGKEIPVAASNSSDAESASAESDSSAEIKSKPEKKKESGALITVIMVVAVILAVFLSVTLFIALPSFAYKWVSALLPFLRPDNSALASLIKSVFEGVLRIIIIVGYMSLVALMKDIRRTFQYHGAEHKTIFCYEHGMELTVENVKAERRFHPRCGTSFLVLMLLVGIFISFLIDPISILISGEVPPTWLRTVIKLLLLPITMGVGYELIKLAGRRNNLFTRIISAPGMWLQHITVFEPTDDMIECAITAFKEVIPEDESDKY